MMNDETFDPNNYPDMTTCPQCTKFMDKEAELCEDCEAEQSYLEEEEA